MTVCHVYPADLAGCGHLRLIWPAEVLRSLGHDVTLFPPGQQTGLPIAVFERNGKRGIKLLARPQCDVVVIQRPLDWKWQLAIPAMKQAGVRVVVDIDDDFHALRGDHVGFWHVHPRTSPDHNWQHMAAALREASTVTMTTEALRQRYGKKNGVVIPNCVPRTYLSLEAERLPMTTIGWSGTTETHPGDLDVVGRAVFNVMKVSGAQFRVLGKRLGVAKALGLSESAVELADWVPIDQYAGELAKLDVGIVPLAMNAFNEAKSWLKGLEMAAVGVPFVSSPTTPYLDLQEAGMGRTASTPADWGRELGMLVRSPTYREEAAARGREAAAKWTIEGNAWRWAEVWLGL